jgi:hypothetical protein
MPISKTQGAIRTRADADLAARIVSCLALDPPSTAGITIGARADALLDG